MKFKLYSCCATLEILGYIHQICWVSLRSTQPTTCQKVIDRLLVFQK